MNRSSNPVFRSGVFGSVAGSGQMTLTGTLAKVGLLFVILTASAAVAWTQRSPLFLFGGLIGSLIFGLATSFKPNWAPFTAPAYAVFEGLLVGSISLMYAERMAKTQYAGAVPLAILGTLAVFAVMLGLYSTRIIKVNQTFMMVVAASTGAIGLTYLVTMVIGMFNRGIYNSPIYTGTPIGILFSVVVIVVAALNLAMDFKMIEDGVNSRAPKFMEWYAGFGLLVTLVWLYLEILRLLSKLSDRR